MEPISHFADAVIAGKTLYVSGLVATDGQGNIVGAGDVVEQTRQIFRNLRRILESAGATPSDVAKLTIFMREVDQRPLIGALRHCQQNRIGPAIADQHDLLENRLVRNGDLDVLR